jgi:NAD(P)H-dependent nitrite reductase small subunit
MPAGKGGAKRDSLVCTCNGVSQSALCKAIAGGKQTVAALKSCTRAGSGCGGCLPQVADVLQTELGRLGKAERPRLCEHFALTRTELFALVRVEGIHTFEELIARHGKGAGCEICKPTAASIFASAHNEMVLDRHATLQDTNDRFLANIQRGGTYSVIPRIPGGEITPDKLIVIGRVAKRYGLYVKITGGQRIDLLGARIDELPNIWEELVNAGFESGHAYAKAIRTVKSCVGSTWCRYGVQDSVGMAIRIEERYRGIRAPHKLKSAVSGCTRECAEAQSKDFGVIATEKGWNLYVCGNGGMKPRHADLLASDLDDDTLIRFIDRFLMYYIRTADRLTRTSVWLDKLEGGIEHLKDVVVRDTLGLGAELERQAQELVDSYECEWKAVVKDAGRADRFRQLINSRKAEPSVPFVKERGQLHPAPWPKAVETPATTPRKLPVLPVVRTSLVRAGRVEDFPRDGGGAIDHGGVQIAVFHVAAEDRWYATQNLCPHKRELVLARGLVGDQGGEPKVACPLHKKTFSLHSGSCLSGDAPDIATFPVRVVNGEVLVELPEPEALTHLRCDDHHAAANADAGVEAAE